MIVLCISWFAYQKRPLFDLCGKKAVNRLDFCSFGNKRIKPWSSFCSCKYFKCFKGVINLDVTRDKADTTARAKEVAEVAGWTTNYRKKGRYPRTWTSISMASIFNLCRHHSANLIKTLQFLLFFLKNQAQIWLTSWKESSEEENSQKFHGGGKWKVSSSSITTTFSLQVDYNSADVKRLL